MVKKGLSIQQERFKNNILEGMDAKNAYIKAGYKARGVVAEVNASRLLRNAKMKAVLDKARKKAAYKAEITQNRILKDEKCLAFFNPQGLLNDEGNILSLDKLPEDVARAIVGLEVLQQTDGALKFKYRFSDKGRSLERLSRHLGMYDDKTSLDISGGLKIIVKDTFQEKTTE